METKKPPLFPLVLLISFAAVSAVLFTPALPDIAKHFHISEQKAGLTISLFLIGYAIGQLPYGPLSDRFGRKKTIYTGLVIALIAACLCSLSGWVNSFSLLLTGRLLMAIGSSVGLKITYTIIADAYKGKAATRALAITLFSFAIAPGVSVFIGGLITQYATWEGNFLFLALYALLLMGTSALIPETCLTPKRDALKLSYIRRGFTKALSCQEILICAGLGGAGTSITYLFASDSPFIGLDVIGLSPSKYGILNLLPAAGMMVGGLSTIKLVNHFKRTSIISTGIALISLSSVAMLVAFLMGWVNSLTLFLPLFFINMGISAIQPNTTTIALHKAENKSYGSATLNFLNIGSSVICILVIGFLFPGNVLMLPIVFCTIAASMIGLRSLLRVDDREID